MDKITYNNKYHCKINFHWVSSIYQEFPSYPWFQLAVRNLCCGRNIAIAVVTITASQRNCDVISNHVFVCNATPLHPQRTGLFLSLNRSSLRTRATTTFRTRATFTAPLYVILFFYSLRLGNSVNGWGCRKGKGNRGREAGKGNGKWEGGCVRERENGE